MNPLDPFGLARPTANAVAGIVKQLTRQSSRAEQQALRLLQSRLDASTAADASTTGRAASGQTALGPRAPKTPTTPSRRMAELLERSLDQDAAGGQQELYLSILDRLLPDEARIIARLAEGPPVPLVHVLPRSGGGRLLENASLIGREAAVTLPSQTPSYVTHLRQLGLVETGPEDEQNSQGYELLLADKAVRAALKEGELGKFPARTVKRTLMLSARGSALWAACRPPEN